MGSADRYLAIFRASPTPLAVFSWTTGRIVDANEALLRLIGWTREELAGTSAHDLGLFDAICGSTEAIVLTTRGGETRWCQSSVERIEVDGEALIVCSLTDITGHMHDRETLRGLESQLRQSQKMEAIGRLAGGIAHDFNNLLTVILSGSEYVIDSLENDRPVELADVADIKKAGKRAAALTHQLLAFSRRQVLAPRILDLNALISNIEKMLRRLIGEDISFTMPLEPRLGLVRADPSQIEQVIVNLAVNARDAMANGGAMTISTSNIDHPGGPRKGRWVRMSVSDNGCGMDEHTKAHLFEPFFTSKEKGKGTGLGLATVYGIVEQSNGFIVVESERGSGARFDIYLPRVAQAERDEPQMTGEIVWSPGKETILLVEDDDAVRRIAGRALREGGYKVYEAQDGEAALLMANDISGTVDLLLSDVVMPGIGGRELSERVRSIRPRTKVLFMSGYTDDEILRRGLSQNETALLAKPFSPQKLLDRVRHVLDETSAAA